MINFALVDDAILTALVTQLRILCHGEDVYFGKTWKDGIMAAFESITAFSRRDWVKLRKPLSELPVSGSRLLERWTLSARCMNDSSILLHSVEMKEIRENKKNSNYFKYKYELQIFCIRFEINERLKKKPPWLWSASELCRPSDRRFLAK
jgi:hypothetical protein